MAVLGHALGGSAERAERWEARLRALRFDPAANLVDWRETRRRPALALRMRLALLVRRFDVALGEELTDWRRLSPRVSAGRERIAFWGPADVVAEVRSWLAGERSPDDAALGELELGTITYVMERHGSAQLAVADHAASCTDVPAIAAGLVTFDRLFREGTASMRTEIRSRRPAPGVASGVASHVLAVRELRVSYWGVVPWYVGWGAHELLGYFELPADPEHTRRLIAEAPPLSIADADDRALADALIALNLGEGPATGAGSPVGPRGDEPLRWEVGFPSPLLMPWRRAVLRPTRRRGGTTLELALAAVARAARVACTTVEVPVEDPASLPAQRQLRASGFRLSALAPPVRAERGGGRHGFTGLWSRVSSDLPVAPPYYLTSTLLTDREREVVSHVRRLGDQWSDDRRAPHAA